MGLKMGKKVKIQSPSYLVQTQFWRVAAQAQAQAQAQMIQLSTRQQYRRHV